MDGDGEFADFVRTNTPALTRTAYLLCGDSLAAEELVQETLVRLYPKWQLVHSRRGTPRLRPTRYLANQFVNQSRRPWRREVTFGTSCPSGRTTAIQQANSMIGRSYG